MAKRKISFSSALRTIGHHKVISLFVLAALIVIGIFVYQVATARIEKHNFEQARAAIDKIYTDIVNQVGPPDSHRRDSNCSKLSRVFNNGPIYCGVSTDLAYGVTSESQSEAIKNKIQSIVTQNNNLFKDSAPPPSDIYTNPAPGTIDSSISYYRTATDVMCSFKYIYNEPSEIDLSIKDPSKKIFEVSIGCWGSARKAYYPPANG